MPLYSICEQMEYERIRSLLRFPVIRAIFSQVKAECVPPMIHSAFEAMVRVELGNFLIGWHGQYSCPCLRPENGTWA